MRWAVACVLVLGACYPPNSTPPHQAVSRVLVRVDTTVEGMPALAECVRLCPPASTTEPLAYCHAGVIARSLIEHRRALGEKTTDRALVCAYGPGAP